jgi:hypothetical protein
MKLWAWFARDRGCFQKIQAYEVHEKLKSQQDLTLKLATEPNTEFRSPSLENSLFGELDEWEIKREWSQSSWREIFDRTCGGQAQGWPIQVLSCPCPPAILPLSTVLLVPLGCSLAVWPVGWLEGSHKKRGGHKNPAAYTLFWLISLPHLPGGSNDYFIDQLLYHW